MRLHFRTKMFLSSKMLRFCFILSLYYCFVKCPYIFGYNSEIIPNINPRGVLIRIHEFLTMSFVFNASIAMLAIGAFDRVLSGFFSLFFNEIKICLNGFYEIVTKLKNTWILNVSNPFLYSYKTKALLE